MLVSQFKCATAYSLLTIASISGWDYILSAWATVA
jgi:hypothetical protein